MISNNVIEYSYLCFSAVGWDGYELAVVTCCKWRGSQPIPPSYFGCCLSEAYSTISICAYILTETTQGAQWLSGRVLDSRPKGRGFEPHRRHCVVSLSKNIYPSLVLVQHRKTRPFITERLLMGRKESKQTNRNHIEMPTSNSHKHSKGKIVRMESTLQ